jgi:hypothetical protein
VRAEDSIDAAWAHLERGWAEASGDRNAKCQLRRDEGPLWAVGYAFDCGHGGDHFFFRTMENCETFKRTMETKAPYVVEDFAPKGVTNRFAWAGTLAACMNVLAKPTAIKSAGLQNLSRVCECHADKVAKSTELPQGQKLTQVLIECMNEAPQDVKATLISMIKENAQSRLPGTAPQAPGSR